MKKQLKEDIMGFTALALVILVLLGGVYFLFIKPMEDMDKDCANALEIEYSFWDGYKEEDWDYEYMNSTHFICCKEGKFVDDKGILHEKGDCKVFESLK